MSDKKYTIGEVSDKINISISALRYYDKSGLLPMVERTPGNIRLFSENDLKTLNMIDCLKATGMQLKDIKVFFEWCSEGDSTIDKRYEMFLERKEDTERQIKILQKSLDLINYKCEYYRKAKEAGTTNIPELQNGLCKTKAKDIKAQYVNDALSGTK